LRKSERQAGAVTVSEIEALVSSDSAVLLAGVRRLEDIGAASPDYLAAEAFVAMVAVAIESGYLSLLLRQAELSRSLSRTRGRQGQDCQSQKAEIAQWPAWALPISDQALSIRRTSLIPFEFGDDVDGGAYADACSPTGR